MRKHICVIISLVCIILLTPPMTMFLAEKEYHTIIVGVTGHKYECGMRADDDGAIISGYIFKDIAIGICVWASDTIIRDCLFINCKDEGIVLMPTGNNNSIIDCIFIECCDGIELQQAHDSIILNCEFIRNWHAGIDIIGDPSYNTLITKCEFIDNKMDVFDLSRWPHD